MARDPRKSGAFDSGIRGREKPKVESGNTGGDRGARGPNGPTGSETKQMPGATVGDSSGVDLSAYTSGMRGIEKPKQKDASGAANRQPAGAERPSGNKQAPHTTVGNPAGHDDAAHGKRSGFNDGAARSKAEDAYALGAAGSANSSEHAATSREPDGEGILGEEDDTHINIRIPKASLKKKTAGMAGSI